MERLTKAHYKASDGYYLTCDAMCRREACTSECNRFGDVIDRLGAYEDTGLSPQACIEAREIEAELSAEDYSIHRMVELMRADKDGRLVVLPEGMETADYMRICTAMLDSADAIGLLRDWADSPGAKCEMALAQYLGKRIIHVDMIQGPVRRAENG